MTRIGFVAHSQDEALKAAGDSLNRVVTFGDTQLPVRKVRTASELLTAEPMTGIEPAYSAWESIPARNARPETHW